jgi:hypothetical protein
MPGQKVVQFIGGGDPPFAPPTILQAEVSRWFHHVNRADHHLAEARAMSEDFLARLQAGASVEPGPHIARINRKRSGKRYVEELEIR